MKRILFLFFLFAISSVTFAQTQQGRVKTRGRLNANGTVTPGKDYQAQKELQFLSSANCNSSTINIK